MLSTFTIVNYNCNMFTVQATEVILNGVLLNIEKVCYTE
jgi:hypothetical protein